ncbi:MAG: hypothetical protein IPL71_09580 [Anaerolineales bacterium]|uniref:hypothetical protein n=1 Tax=Candidatus Villigracilis proximus TaxID=3140683 RepID=UPI00313465AE|nr:hypothetical protein [Anaerolineales bacterium]
MSNINDEMKTAAEYTIKAAKEKFGQELDFSQQSIVKLEGFLEQAYRESVQSCSRRKSKDFGFSNSKCLGKLLRRTHAFEVGWNMGTERLRANPFYKEC